MSMDLSTGGGCVEFCTTWISLLFLYYSLLCRQQEILCQTTRALRENMTTNTLIFTLPCSIPSFYLVYQLYKKNFLGQIFNKQFAITLIISGKICGVIISTEQFLSRLLQERSHHTPWHSRWMDFSEMRVHQGSHHQEYKISLKWPKTCGVKIQFYILSPK